MTTVKVRVLPGALFSDNRATFRAGDEMEMSLDEANRRIAQGKVEMVGPLSLNATLGKLSAADAIAAANKALTPEVLAELKNGEDRKTVLAAIEAREHELAEGGK